MTPRQRQRRLARERRRLRAIRRDKSRCRRCGKPPLEGLRSCARCMAYDIERNRPDQEHDTAAHAAMLLAARDVGSKCAASGYTLAQLQLIGQELEVDRIESWVGYVGPNLQLLARTLNRSKGCDVRVPEYALARLYERAGEPHRADEYWRAWA